MFSCGSEVQWFSSNPELAVGSLTLTRAPFMEAAVISVCECEAVKCFGASKVE